MSATTGAGQARCSGDDEALLVDLARALGERALAAGAMIATAESCTGGGIAAAITEVAGSSAWFDRGFVTYSNAAKQQVLGVGAATLSAHGAVSEAVAAEMALGALARSDAAVAIAVTGIAGPAGGSPDKPVGTVCFACARRGGAVSTQRLAFDGDRRSVRRGTVARALRLLAAAVDELPGEAPPSGSGPAM